MANTKTGYELMNKKPEAKTQMIFWIFHEKKLAFVRKKNKWKW